MEQRIARLRTHQKNIDWYQSLLKTKLSDVEQQFLERLLFGVSQLRCCKTLPERR
jgi:hypothetical protein